MDIERVLNVMRAHRKRLARELFSMDVVGDRGNAQARLDGYSEAIETVKTCFHDERLRRESKYGKITRWAASELRYACQTAFRYLNQCDKPKAMNVLRRTLDKYPMKGPI